MLDCANEWTEDISPLLVIKVPKIERKKDKKINNKFHFLKTFLDSCAYDECKKAVNKSQGIKATFSTGSHAQ